VATRRRYVDGTALLETTFTTADGEVALLDVMPVGDGRADVVRRLTCTRGTVRMRHDWVVRADYGLVRPWVSREHAHGHEVVVAVAGPDKFVLRGPHLPHGHHGHHSNEFELSAGDEVTFSTTWVRSWHDVPEPLSFDERIDATTGRQRAWSARAPEDVPHADLVRRSLLTLLLMTHAETGGIVAAPTTSLPEDFGGERNWDYRFCWLRDAALTLESLLGAGYDGEALEWRGWLLRAVAGDPADLQIMYTVDGGRQLPEREVPHLPGYAGSTPVRIGNGAVSQRQNDVLGEVMIALELARDAGLEETPNSWALQRALVDELADHWDQPDNGLWEIRGPQRHFTHSRVMVWVAFDRAVKGVERHDLDGPVDRWRDLRDRVREEILDKGFDHERGTFTQHYDTTAVDASLLTIGLVGFLPGDDPRVLGTIDAVIADLDVDGLLLRYRTETGVDGIAGDEHPFLACSFWLVSALAAAGRRDQAGELMDRLCGLANDVGLLSEEYDVTHSRMAGNFPQAFSHLALVQAALALR
jgi:GH15 family glucan-1,4-alpha-glucosidase